MAWKIAGSVILLVPIGFFLLFAIGEGASGWSHYIQLAFVFAMAFAGWRFPLVGSYALIAFGIAGGAFYALANDFPLPTLALVELIVFLPLVLSGMCFLRTAR